MTEPTSAAALARRGFEHTAAAVAHLATLALTGAELAAFDRTSDPDQALAALVELAEVASLQLGQVRTDPTAWTRLVAVLGGSSALATHLVRHPEDLTVLHQPPQRLSALDLQQALLVCVGADPDADQPVASLDDGPPPRDRLRLANRRQLLRIAATDLTSPDPAAVMDEVAGELSDLADAVLVAAMAVARLEVPTYAKARLGVVGLGKCGAQELNYLSDVDVLFVAEPADPSVSNELALQTATKVAGALTQICSAHTAAGTIWELDAALRPEGKAGPLVRSLASMAAYYRSWARNWEFQAMLKARPVAGDLDLARDFVELVSPMVWSAAERDHFMAETQAMRQRVIAHIPAKERDRELKLSEGGLRDTEFTVQLLQLVHGRADESLRLAGTLPALRALIAKGYIGRDEGADLEQAYRFQRTLEHRVQLSRLRRTHLLPDDEQQLRALARGLGERGGAAELTKAWRASAVKVRRLHQRVFYSPLLDAVARIPSTELTLSADAVRDRMRVLGFADPAGALRHIEALTRGSARRSQIQRQLMPAMLGWLASAPNPDHGLLAFRQLSEALGESPWYLRALRDEGKMAERVAILLSTSRLVVDLLKRAPEAVQMLSSDDELVPRSCDQITASMTSVAGRHHSAAEAIKAIRAVRRRELLRVAVANLLDLTDVVVTGRALSDLTRATVTSSLAVAARGVDQPPEVAVIAMGRWGGHELSYGSDADAMFVVADSDDPEAVKKAGQMIAQVRQWLSAPGPDPALDLDPDLRPEGKGGPMVRTLSSYRAYYQRWSETWEAQALIRADLGGGSDQVAAELLASVDSLRWPEDGLSPQQLAEIRKLKARMEVERIPRGADPRRNLKLGPGGLSDVEWTVQTLQLGHAGRIPPLRTTETLTALAAAVEAELIESSAADTLRQAWMLASRIRNALMLTRGRPSDVLPVDPRELAATAALLGYGPGQSSELVEEQARTARRAARVVDHYFWGRS